MPESFDLSSLDSATIPSVRADIMVKAKFQGAGTFPDEGPDRFGLRRGDELLPADHAAARERPAYDHLLPALGAGQEGGSTQIRHDVGRYRIEAMAQPATPAVDGFAQGDLLGAGHRHG